MVPGLLTSPTAPAQLKYDRSTLHKQTSCLPTHFLSLKRSSDELVFSPAVRGMCLDTAVRDEELGTSMSCKIANSPRSSANLMAPLNHVPMTKHCIRPLVTKRSKHMPTRHGFRDQNLFHLEVLLFYRNQSPLIWKSNTFHAYCLTFSYLTVNPPFIYFFFKC